MRVAKVERLLEFAGCAIPYDVPSLAGQVKWEEQSVVMVPEFERLPLLIENALDGFQLIWILKQVRLLEAAEQFRDSTVMNEAISSACRLNVRREKTAASVMGEVNADFVPDLAVLLTSLEH